MSRCCGNCDNSSWSYECESGFETLYCSENPTNEFQTDSSNVCGLHKFIPGTEEEKNYLFYDNSYLGPGYIVVSRKDGKINKFFKIYNMSNYGFPEFGFRAFSVDGHDDIDKDFTNIEFTFNENEDNENGLFNIFKRLCNDLGDNKIKTIDSSRQGENNISLYANGDEVTLVASKDIFEKNTSEFVNIIIGDNYTCNKYRIVHNFYSSLVDLCPPYIEQKEIEEILSLKLK